MDIVESINRYLAGSPTNKSERTRLTRARDEIVRLRTASQETINGRTVKVDWKAQALELRELVRLGGIKIAELETALAEQPAQHEPVAGLLVGQDSDGRYATVSVKAHAETLPLGEYKLYTSPPAQRKPLTDE